MGKTYLIQNGYVIDPANQREGYLDILIQDGRIKKVEKGIPTEEAMEVLDASGKTVMPGFVDLHVHFREPGFEYKETVHTGSRSAAAGGFTTVCPMPNTRPPIDTPKRVRELLSIAERDAVVHVLPVGAVTLGQEGKVAADIPGMKEAGAVAISEDGKSVMDIEVYEEGMRLAARAGIPVLAHCEDKELAGNGVVNEGAFSRKYNLPGISNEVENKIARRDIALSEKTGARLHLCHCSTKETLDYIREAKEKRLPVSGEVCPHHFTLSDQDIPGDDAAYKMNPPLRAPEDVEAMKKGLKEGIFEAISTDHAPHGWEEKQKSMREAPFGIVGLETAFSLAVTNLVNTGLLTPYELVRRMSTSPAGIIGAEAGTLSEGVPADVVIADFKEEYTIDKEKFLSKGRNTPFDGWKVAGRVYYTLVDGEIVYQYN